MKISWGKLLATFLVVSFFSISFSFSGPMAASAAADPALGAAATFSVLAQTSITGISTISGNVGINSTGAGITALTAGNVAGTIYSTDGVAPSVASPFLSASVQANASTAFTSNIPGQGADGSIGPVLDGLTVAPGVWDIGAGRLNGGILHLNGAGIYIFRASSDFISSGSISLENGARACDVYWNVTTLATINGTSFVGTILAGTGVHFGSGVTLNGRALAVGGDVTMINDVISGPTCAVVLPVTSTISVVKTVLNYNRGTKTIADFPLFVSGTPVVSGETNVFTASSTYTITETGDSRYAQSFSGDCNTSGQLTLAPGQAAVCLITNDFARESVGSGPIVVPPVVPPLISVVKVPSPLALPDGPGLVTYTYTLRNVGTVSVTDVTMVGDTCSPIVLNSGDINNDAKLDVNETWVYSCATNLTETHTNTVVATGWANGISATDIANATVIVGIPVVPPLIHVTKIPSPLVLPVMGGAVTYTYQITNPGTVALSNVQLNDDKCGPRKFVSGDVNDDRILGTSETWTYTCRTNLLSTTMNTAVATGDANGLTARDFAIATVVVPAVVPALPNTGFDPAGVNKSVWSIVVAGILVLVSISFGLMLKKSKL